MKLIFLLGESENRVGKSCFYQELWYFENSIWIFNFCTKSVDISKIMGTRELISITFQKL